MSLDFSKLDPDEVMEAAKECLFGTKDTGFCLACGFQMDIESDAEKIECESCGEPKVYGAGLLMELGAC